MLLNPYRFGVPSWRPSNLPDLRAWYVSDYSGNTLTSGELATIFDLSGRGNHMTNLSGSAGNRATMVSAGLNGRAVWRSDASSKRGAFNCAQTDGRSITTSVSGVTLFAVQRMNPAQTVVADASVIRFTTATGTASRAMIGRGDSAVNAIYVGGRRTDTDSYAGAADATNYSDSWRLIVGVIDYANARVDVSVDGAITATNPSFQTPSNSDSAVSQYFAIGHNGNGATHAYGDYAELGAIRLALGLSDRQKLEGYLAWQWGLDGNLPGGHPYKSSPP